MSTYLVRDASLTHIVLETPAGKGVARAKVPVKGQGFFRTVTLTEEQHASLPDALARKLLPLPAREPAGE